MVLIVALCWLATLNAFFIHESHVLGAANKCSQTKVTCYGQPINVLKLKWAYEPYYWNSDGILRICFGVLWKAAKKNLSI